MNTFPSRPSRRLLWLKIAGMALFAMLISLYGESAARLAGMRVAGMAGDASGAEPLRHFRILSLLHGGLPFMLFLLVKKLGYDRRALAGWFVICTVMSLVSLFCFPPAGALLADPRTPRNINHVFGMDDMRPQEWIDPGTYVFLWITALAAVAFVPAHVFLKKGGNTASPTGA